MAPKKTKQIVTFILLLIIGAVFTFGVVYSFNNIPDFKGLFSGAESPVLGNVGPESEATLAQRADFTAQVSMWIFIFITVLQMIAFWVGYNVVSGIKNTDEPAAQKLRNLDNAEIFFDVPLYFGLFGTVSAFLVMTFSPQSSRLIAYSSTLIGIIFSLLLRLILQYPLRSQLLKLDAENNKGENK